MPIHPVVGAQILFPDGPRTFRHEGAPARFLPGWKPVLAYSGLAPLVIVCFRHEGGGHGMWFLDRELNRQGGRVEELPGPALASLMDALCPLLDGLLEQLLSSGRPRAPLPGERSFLDLPPFCRDALAELFLAAFRRDLAVRPFDRPGTGSADTPVLDLGRRRIPLRLGGLHALFDPGLLVREGRRLPVDGRMTLNSPVDGQPLDCDRALVLDEDLLAYRLHDPRWMLTSWLIAGGDGFRTLALFVPDAALVLVAHDEPDPGRWSDLASRFDRHLLRHGEALFGFLAADRIRPLLLWRGVAAGPPGRGCWHDLAGLAALVDAAPSSARPECLLPAAEPDAEPFGRLDALFPELRGRIRRRAEVLSALADELYRDRACLYRTSGSRIDAALRARVLRQVPRREDARPVLLLALSNGDASLANAPELAAALAVRLGERFDAAVLVLEEGGAVGGPSSDPVPANETGAVAAAASEAAAASPDGTVAVVRLDAATPVSERLSWCDAAGMFVAVSGPALAAYRWGCDRPGLVLVDRRSLDDRPEPRVYADPAFAEASAPLDLVASEPADDLPDGGSPRRRFAVDVPAVLARFDRMAADHLRPGTVPPVPEPAVEPAELAAAAAAAEAGPAAAIRADAPRREA